MKSYDGVARLILAHLYNYPLRDMPWPLLAIKIPHPKRQYVVCKSSSPAPIQSITAGVSANHLRIICCMSSSPPRGSAQMVLCVVKSVHSHPDLDH